MKDVARLESKQTVEVFRYVGAPLLHQQLLLSGLDIVIIDASSGVIPGIPILIDATLDNVFQHIETYVDQTVVLCVADGEISSGLEEQLLAAGAVTFLNIKRPPPDMARLLISYSNLGKHLFTTARYRKDAAFFLEKLMTYDDPLVGFQQVSESLRKMLGCGSIFLILLDDKQTSFECYAIEPYTSRLDFIKRMPAPISVGGDINWKNTRLTPSISAADEPLSYWIDLSEDILSLVSLPLHKEQQHIGRIVFTWPTESGYDIRHLFIMRHAAALFTLNFLENRAKQHAAHSMQLVNLLTDSIATLASGQDMDAILANITTYIQSHFNITSCQITLINGTQSIRGQLYLDDRIRFDNVLELVVQSVCENKNAAVIAPAVPFHNESIKQELLQTDGVGSVIVVPIVFQEAVLGTISLIHRSLHTFLTVDDAAMLQTVANQLAFAIQNARLFTRATDSVQRMESLFRTAHSLVAFDGVDTVLQKIIDDTVALLDASRGVFYVFDFEEKAVRFCTNARQNANQTATFSRDYDELMEGLTGWVLDNQETAISSGHYPDPRESLRVQKRRFANGSPQILVAPLYHLDDKLGTLTLTRTTNHPPFTEHDAAIITAIANLAAVGVKTATLFQDVKSNLQRTNILLDTAQAIITTQGLRQLLITIIDSVVEKLNSDSGVAIMLDIPQKQVLEVCVDTVWFSYHNRPPAYTYQGLIDGLTGHVIRTKQAVISPEGIDDPREAPDIQRRRRESKTGAIMVAPLIYEDGVIGTLTVVRSLQSEAYTVQDLALLEATAKMASVAIRNMRLQEETKTALSYSRIMLDTAQLMITAENSGEMVQAIIDYIVCAFDAYSSSYQILDVENEQIISANYDSEQSIRRETGKSIEPAGIGYSYHELMEGITGYAIREKKAQLSLGNVPDLRESPAVQARRQHEGIGSVMIAPIINQGRVIGTIGLGRLSGQPEFTEADLETFAAVASQMSFALSNVRTYEDLKEHANTLHERVHENNEILKHRNRELNDANERLLELDRMKDKFVVDVSHELRTPVSSLKLYLTLLERGKEERRARYLATMHREVERLELLVGDILRLTRLDMGRLQNTIDKEDTVDLHQLIHDQIGLYQARFEDAQLALQLQLESSQPILTGSRIQLAEMLEILIKNALTYTSKGYVAIETADDEAADQLILRVRDSGRGIPADERQKIFDRLYRGSNAHDVPGSGLGLSILKEIVAIHNGEITVDSVLEEGAIFTIHLPRPLSLL